MLMEYSALTTLRLNIQFSKRRTDNACSIIDDSEGRSLRRIHSSTIPYPELSDHRCLPLRDIQINAMWGWAYGRGPWDNSIQGFTDDSADFIVPRMTSQEVRRSQRVREQVTTQSAWQ
jgi:hypothetical protein